MKTREIINEFGIGDVSNAARASMYRNLGIGGDAANEIAAQQSFVKRFTQQLKLSNQSKTASIPNMITAYMAQHNWVANAEQSKMLQDLAAQAQRNPKMYTQLAKEMWQVGQEQIRDQNGMVQGQGQGQQSADPSKLNLDGKPEAIDPGTKQIIAAISKLRGKHQINDLTKIAKKAMQMLYKLDPTAYKKLYQQIMSGKGPTPKTNNAGGGAFANMGSELSKYAPRPAPKGIENGQKRLSNPDTIDDPNLTRIINNPPQLGNARTKQIANGR